MIRPYLLILILILSSCSGGKPKSLWYKSFNNNSSLKLKVNSFRIYFGHNDDSSLKIAQDFALLKSAQVTLHNGFKYFIIEEKEILNGTLTNLKSYETLSHRQTTREVKNSFPGVVYIIVCFKSKEEFDGTNKLYNAIEVEEDIKSKYKNTLLWSEN